LKESNQRLKQFEVQNSKKDSLRKELEQKLTKLREMEVNIEQEQVKNGNLRKVSETENELRKFRDKKETDLLNIASKTQVDSANWISQNLNTVGTEDDRIRKETQALRDKMEKRKNTIVKQLLTEIENDCK
jgi:capsule polysaccharide export protein KpsE/RkpR